MNWFGRGAALLRGTAAEAGRDPAAAAVALLGLSAIGMAMDRAGESMVALVLFGTSVLSFAAQYVLTRRTMRAGGLLPADAPGAVFGLFVLSLLSNLAIIAGLLLLVVPGVWMYLRWLMAAPVLFAEQPDATGALGVSARRSAGWMGPAAVAALVVNLPLIVAMAAGMFLPYETTLDPLVSAGINALLSIGQISGWYLAVAFYRATRPDPVASVFD